MQIKEIAIVGVFSALAYAGGYALIFVPNVEIFTALIFLAGLIFGVRIGVLVGCIASFLFGVLNPYGVSPLPLLVAQVLSRMLVGFAGGLLRSTFMDSKPFWFRGSVYGVTSVFLIWTYILFTSLGGLIAFGYSFDQFKVYFLSGLPSYLLLSVCNVLVFVFLLPWITPIIRQSPYFAKYRAN